MEENPVERLGMRVPSDPRYLGSLRDFVYSVALRNGFSKRSAFDWKIVCGEALSNVIRYAYSGRKDGVILLEILIFSRFMEVRIRDFGKKSEMLAGKAMDLSDYRESGLGLFLIGKLTDFHFFDRSVDRGTRLILKKRME